MKIAVAGGTGVAGRFVVEAVRARGHEPVVLSRGQGVDLVSGSGLDTALTGADAVIDVSNVTTNRKSVAVGFFEKAGRNLIGAAERAGVRHLVTPSIVGSTGSGTPTTRASCARRRSSGAGRCHGPSCGRRSSTSSWVRR